MFIVEANANKAWCLERDLLTSGSKGLDVELRFSSDWDDLAKFAVFEAYDRSEVSPVEGDTVEIPEHVMAKPDVNLFLGLFGVNEAGTVIIPTVYVDLGTIRKGASISGADNFGDPQELAGKILAIAEAALKAASGTLAGSVSFSVDPETGNLLMTVTEGGTPSSTPLGRVVGQSAYETAVDAGYTDSYEDFKALLIANYATNQDVQEAKANAAQALSAAQSASDTATSAASDAEDAQEAAEAAQTAAETAASSKQSWHHRIQVTLASGQSTWTKTGLNYVTATNTVIVTPAPTSFSAWVTAGVYCSEQGDGTLKFTAAASPSQQLTANVVILDEEPD